MSGLEGRRVLITRAVGQAGELSLLLRAQGAIPVEVAGIEVEPIADAGVLTSALRALGESPEPRWIAFTSVNTVRAVLDQIDVAALVGLRIAAVGTITAAALRSRGVSVDLVPDDQSAGGLGAALVAVGVRGAAVWLPQAEGAREELEHALCEAGAEVVTTTAYRLVVPVTLRAELQRAVQAGVDAATFFSPSAVRHIAAGGLSPAIPAVCIGDTTASEARACGFLTVQTAAEPSSQAVIAAIRAVLRG